jgi:urease alpha subunit
VQPRRDQGPAAYAMKQDATTGSLEAGKRAHLVVLDRDILSVDPETIADTKVVTTYLDGQLVYAAPTGGAAEPRRTKRVLSTWGRCAKRVTTPGYITINQFARITTQSSDRRFSSAQALRAEPSEKSAKRARYHCVSSF